MHKLRCSVLFSFSALLCFAGTSDFRYANFAFKLPQNSTVKNITRRYDAAIMHQLINKADGRIVFSIYIGNSPRFPTRKWDTEKCVVERNNCIETRYSTDGAEKVEILLDYRSVKDVDGRHPQYRFVHIMAFDLHKGDDSILNNFINGIKLVKP